MHTNDDDSGSDNDGFASFGGDMDADEALQRAVEDEERAFSKSQANQADNPEGVHCCARTDMRTHIRTKNYHRTIPANIH